MKSKITKEIIDEIYLNSTKKIETVFGKCTIMTIQLENGFILSEISACVDIENYDNTMGLEICEKKLKNKLWELEGYKLQCKIHEEKSYE